MALTSFPTGGTAVVIGASGGIGAMICENLRQESAFGKVLAFSRQGEPVCDITREADIEAAASLAAGHGDLRLVLVTSGFLHGSGFAPEKSWRDLSSAHMAHAFATNAIGPALVMKHFLPLLAASGKTVFGALSARVGSISDNRLGGWHSYRASKAALNQMIRCNAIELARRRREAICVALHPGTVETPLSEPFAKSGLDVRPAAQAASEILQVVDHLTPEQSGGFFDHHGVAIPW